jgi:hypothetical protein
LCLSCKIFWKCCSKSVYFHCVNDTFYLLLTWNNWAFRHYFQLNPLIEITAVLIICGTRLYNFTFSFAENLRVCFRPPHMFPKGFSLIMYQRQESENTLKWWKVPTLFLWSHPSYSVISVSVLWRINTEPSLITHRRILQYLDTNVTSNYPTDWLTK